MNNREQVGTSARIMDVPCLVVRHIEGAKNSEFRLVKRAGMPSLRAMAQLAGKAKTREAVVMHCNVTGGGMTRRRETGKRHLAQSN